MSWVRIEDAVTEHPKHLKAGPAAAWLWVCGIAYCQRQLSDGFIPDQAITLIGVGTDLRRNEHPTILAKRLVRVGLFDRVPGGYQVHDYHDFNDTRSEALQRKEVIREQRRNAGLASGRIRLSRVEQRVNGAVHSPFNEIEPHPNPIPIPSQKNVRSSADADFETFRTAYPVSRRVGGKLARNAFRNATCTTNLGVMLAALRQHKRSEQWQDPALIPLMTTWLNQERWTQVLPEPAQTREYEPWNCPHNPRCAHRAACAVVSARVAQ